MKWTYFAGGNNNSIYISCDNTSILKIQLDQTEKTDCPDRAVLLWNEINSDITPKAYVIDSEYGLGWVCPYIKGDQSSDGEMKKALIKIYNDTGRIVVDAVAPNNFITQADGKVVCVDVSLALLLDNRLGINLRQSTESLNYWSEMSTSFDGYFSDREVVYPQTVHTIKALLYIRFYQPHIKDASFLQENRELTAKFANAYNARHVEPSVKQLSININCPQPEPKKTFLVSSVETAASSSNQLTKKIQKKQSSLAKNPCSFNHPNPYKDKLRQQRGQRRTYNESSQMNCH